MAPAAALAQGPRNAPQGKLIEQLPWGQRGRAGSKFVLKAHPQAVSQEGDHDVGFDPLGSEVPDRTDGQIAFECADDGFNLGKLNVLAPEFGRITLLQVGAQQIGSVATGSQAQFVAIPLPAQTRVLKTDFHVSPGLLVTLLESAHLEKDFGRVFKPAMAKQPP
jgi:hypothetical protein